LLGETLGACGVSSSGLDGDRALALVDIATGNIASAKQPNLWRDLLNFGARIESSSTSEKISVTDAAGYHLHYVNEGLDEWLSDLLGRSVRVIKTKTEGISLNRARPDEVLEHGMDEAVTQDLLAIGAAAPD